MAGRSAPLAGVLILGFALAPSVCRADIRIEETSTALGSKITRWIAIKGDKRALVTKHETTGTLYNAGARYGAVVEIARPDKELIWELDPQERSYKEVTAEQFSRVLQKGIQAPRNANDQPLRTLYRSETTAIEVVPTGREKRIAGYNAEEVVARVVVGAQNLVSGNKFVFTFDQQIWITKDERILKEVKAFEEAYTDTFGSAASLAQARLVAGEWSDAFTTHLRAVNDRVRALGGFPLAHSTTVTEESIAQAKNEKGTKRQLQVASGEVRRITLESVPDREFEPPAGYINSDTKVAYAPAAPAMPNPAEQPRPAVVMAPPPAEAPVKQPEKMPAVAQAPVEQPKPVVEAARPPVEAPKPVAEAPKPVAEAPKPVAEAPKPAETPKPVAAAPVTPAEAPKPAAEPRKPVVVRAEPVPVVTGAPTNVVVSGARIRTPKGEIVRVEGYQAPVITGNYPILQPGGLSAATQAPPPPVVIDEAEIETTKKKKKKSKK